MGSVPLLFGVSAARQLLHNALTEETTGKCKHSSWVGVPPHETEGSVIVAEHGYKTSVYG